MYRCFLNVLGGWYRNYPFLIVVSNILLAIAGICLIVWQTDLDPSRLRDIFTEFNMRGVVAVLFFVACVYVSIVLAGMLFYVVGRMFDINEYDEMRLFYIVMPVSIFALIYAFNDYRTKIADTTQSELGGIDVDKSKTDSEYVKKLANDIELWLTHRIGARS